MQWVLVIGLGLGLNVSLPSLNIEDEALYGGGWLLGSRGGCGGAVLADDTVYIAVSH